MKIPVAVCVVVLAATPGFAQTFRINGSFDTSSATIDTFGSSRSLFWHGREGEFELEWSHRHLLLNGLAIGVRKEGQYYSDGTYFTFRVFGRIPVTGKRLGLYPSLGVVYGLPGLPMLRTYEDGTWVFPVRTIDIPATEVHGDGILYPELSVALRLKFWHFSIEPVIGFRYIQFGAQRDDQYSHGRVLVPTLGFRAGFGT